MKKYLALLSISLVSAALLIYFYSQESSQLARSQHEISSLILKAKHIDTTLDKDLLKSRNFFLQSYDPIVNSEHESESICTELRSLKPVLLDNHIEKLESAVADYCNALENKLQMVEDFKSRNAIIRNSLYFIHTIGVEKHSPTDEKIIQASLAYLVVSTDVAKARLEKYIAMTPQSSPALPHAIKILSMKQELDRLTEQVISSNTGPLLENLRQAFFLAGIDSERRAENFQSLVLAICLALLVLTVFGVTRIWSFTHALSDANTNLERRVEERTSDLRKSQETIIQQQQLMISSAKMSALGEMAGGIAHEINTPLATIQMSTEQLQEMFNDGSADEESVVQTTDIILRTTSRIATIVSGLRNFSRDGSRDPVGEVKVAAVVHESVSLCQERFKNRGIEIRISDFDENLLAIGRQTQLSQVLVNLLNNAYDAIVESQEKWVSVSIVPDVNMVGIQITDSGTGIPEATRSKIFQPFFTTKEIGKGTGLGLSISLGIVQNLGGTLVLDPNCANTRFIVNIPRHPLNGANQRAVRPA